MGEERDSRPTLASGPARNSILATQPTFSLAALDDLAVKVDGAFVVVVKLPGGRYKRRPYLTAASAERAARRAVDRGEDAVVYLAELKPLWKLTSSGEPR